MAARGEPARKEWNDAPWEAAAEDRLRLTPVPGGKSGERSAAGALRELRTIALWPFMLAAGLTIWTLAIYGLLSRLNAPFN